MMMMAVIVIIGDDGAMMETNILTWCCGSLFYKTIPISDKKNSPKQQFAKKRLNTHTWLWPDQTLGSVTVWCLLSWERASERWDQAKAREDPEQGHGNLGTREIRGEIKVVGDLEIRGKPELLLFWTVPGQGQGEDKALSCLQLMKSLRVITHSACHAAFQITRTSQ